MDKTDEEFLAGQNGILYDMEGDYNPNALPNTEELMDTVNEILSKMVTPYYKNLKTSNYKQYVEEMERLFPDFSFRYYALFLQVINGEDITPLVGMLLQIDKLKRNEITIDDAEKVVGELLANRYIYPNVNANK